MKQKKNPYVTNQGGYIKAPTTPSKGDPRATVTVAKKGGDLRGGK